MVAKIWGISAILWKLDVAGSPLGVFSCSTNTFGYSLVRGLWDELHYILQLYIMRIRKTEWFTFFVWYSTGPYSTGHK